MNIRVINRNAILLTLCIVFAGGEVQAQDRFIDSKSHRNGKLWVEVTNFGQFGSDQAAGAIWPGSEVPAARYINRGGLFIGGIVPSDATTGPDLNAPGDLDTLVSEGPSAWSVVDFREMAAHYPDARSAIEVRSTNPASPDFHPDAVSGEDFIAVYTDTFLIANGFVFNNSKHQRALGIEITEKSYQFSVSFAEDIVFFDLVIRNIGNNFIRNMAVGFFADNDMTCLQGNIPNPPNNGQRDDATGFMAVNSTGDVVNTAWVAEPDGDDGCMPGVVGVRVLRPTAADGVVSFNWWLSDSEVSSADDWGPITPNVQTGASNEGEVIGSPEFDVDKYTLMTNGSFDEPQFDPVRFEFNPNIPAGADPNDNSRFLISFSPLGTRDSTINDPGDPMNGQTVKIFAPGDELLFTYAVIGGEGDADVARAQQTFDTAALVDLGVNASIAGIMFDNIGFDTDGDGFAGNDTDGDGVIDTGDGVPDFRGPPPPPAPPLTVTTGDRTVTLDWSAADPSSANYDPSGTDPLNFQDPFISDDPNTLDIDESKDFEGFRVLRSQSGTLGTFELLAEWDITGNAFGRNTGLEFRYVDHVPNGQEFTYAVVSFDRGAPSIGLGTLATSPLATATRVAASATPAAAFGDKLVWVEPNPYIDRSGFENFSFTSVESVENNRVLHFVNVPSNATIRIFTVDGDHVQTIVHDSDTSSRVTWNLVSRNTRPVASGIYLFQVETPNGDQQIGRFVIIK